MIRVENLRRIKEKKWDEDYHPVSVKKWLMYTLPRSGKVRAIKVVMGGMTKHQRVVAVTLKTGYKLEHGGSQRTTEGFFFV